MKYIKSLIDNSEYDIKLIPESQEEIDDLNKYWKKGVLVDIFISEEDVLIIEMKNKE